MTSIEAEHESASALIGTTVNLIKDIYYSSLHSFEVYILVALDLVCADTVLLYALLKLVSPLSGSWHVRIM